MGVKTNIISRWIENGLIQPVAKFGSMHYFSRRGALEFQRDHIFTDEAAKILGMGVLAVQKWARNGRLKPVAGHSADDGHRYLFKRSEVNYLSKCVSSEYIMQLYGVSRSTIGEWIKHGILKPVSGPGVDNSGHYLFDGANLDEAIQINGLSY